jgi:hypothetical protein
MKKTIAGILLACCACLAQKETIDLEHYKTSKRFTTTERSYLVGAHTYRILNIKPVTPSDTACISAIVFDKRKYVMFDVGVPATGALGLIVPAAQPITGSLLIVKPSPYDGKMFLLQSTGKVISLPGASVIVDTIASTLYCVWDNDKSFWLTVFDYKNLRLIFKTTRIEEPKQWFTDGVSYSFSTTDPAVYYTVDFMTKEIVKGGKPDGALSAIPYFGNIDKFDRASCCGVKAFGK